MSDVRELQPQVKGKWAAWVGFFLHLAVGVFPYSASGLVAPLWGIIAAYVVWFALLFLALRLWNRYPYWVLAVPVAAVAWWWFWISLGDIAFGWQA